MPAVKPAGSATIRQLQAARPGLAGASGSEVRHKNTPFNDTWEQWDIGTLGYPEAWIEPVMRHKI